MDRDSFPIELKIIANIKLCRNPQSCESLTIIVKRNDVLRVNIFRPGRGGPASILCQMKKIDETPRSVGDSGMDI